MNVVYEIHSCVLAPFAAQATIAGIEQEVVINGLIVEAVSEDGSMGHTFKLRGPPEQLAAAKARADEGGKLLVQLSVSDPANEGSMIPLNHPLPKVEPVEVLAQPTEE